MQNNPIAHQRILDCAYIDVDTLSRSKAILKNKQRKNVTNTGRMSYQAEHPTQCSIAYGGPLSIRLPLSCLYWLPFLS